MTGSDEAARRTLPGLKMHRNRVSDSGRHGIRISIPDTMSADIGNNIVARTAADGISVTVRQSEELVRHIERAELTPQELQLLVQVLEQTVSTTKEAAADVEPKSHRVAEVLQSVTTTLLTSTTLAYIKEHFHLG